MKSQKDGKKPRKSHEPKPVASRPPAESCPEITVTEAPVGRATLHAIWEDQQSARAPRSPLVTVGYDEVPPRQAVIRPSPIIPPRQPLVSSPDISVSETPIGLRTLMDIKEVIDQEKRAAAPYAQANVLELLTFVILDNCLPARATEEEKRAFVQQRLSKRLPGGIDSVRRIELRPADESALLLRVWCELPLP